MLDATSISEQRPGLCLCAFASVHHPPFALPSENLCCLAEWLIFCGIACRSSRVDCAKRRFLSAVTLHQRQNVTMFAAAVVLFCFFALRIPLFLPESNNMTFGWDFCRSEGCGSQVPEVRRDNVTAKCRSQHKGLHIFLNLVIFANGSNLRCKHRLRLRVLRHFFGTLEP